jgi:hypothetical protein
MKKFLSVSAIGLALALVANGALAQSGAKKPAAAPASKPAAAAPASSDGVGAGDKEVGFFGSFSDNDDTGTSLSVGVSIGRYWTDTLQWRVTQFFNLSEDPTGAQTVIYAPYGSLEFQFPGMADGKLVPYAGGGIGMFLLTTEATDFYSLFLTPTGGLKYFLSERTSVEYALSYQIPISGEACTGGFCGDVDITTLQNSLRFNVYF